MFALLMLVPYTRALTTPRLDYLSYLTREPHGVNKGPLLPCSMSRNVPWSISMSAATEMGEKGRSPPAMARRRKSDWRVLTSLCITDFPVLIASFVALTLAAVGDALRPQLQSEALNVLLYTEPALIWTKVRAPLVKLLYVGVLTALFTAIRGFLFWLSGARLVKRLRAQLFKSLLSKPQSFFDTRSTGELSSRLGADCVKLSDVLSLNVNIVLRQLMQSFVGIAIVANLSQKLALLVLAGVALRGALNYAYAAVNKRLANAQQTALASSASVADQCLTLVQEGTANTLPRGRPLLLSRDTHTASNTHTL